MNVRMSGWRWGTKGQMGSVSGTAAAGTALVAVLVGTAFAHHGLDYKRDVGVQQSQGVASHSH